jgi:hypothetical protein
MPAREPGLDAIAAALLARAEHLVERQLAALHTFPTYERVPGAALRASALRNVYRVAAALRGSDELPETAEAESSSGRARALQGIPTEEVLGAYRAVMNVLREEFLAAAVRLEVPVASVLAGTHLLWDLTDRFSAELGEARRQIDVDFARRDERARLAFLQRLLAGTLLASEVAVSGSAFGLSADAEYWVCRGRQGDAAPGGSRRTARESLARRLERLGAGGLFHPLVGSIDGDVVAVTATRPPPADFGRTDGGVLAIAGPVALAALPHAFAEATRLLNVAVRYHRSGLVDNDSLSVRIAVAEESELSEALMARYVEPVAAACGSTADVVLASVRSYLAHRRHVGETAAALSVHTNTVRYRLARYTEATGADLGDTETLIEAWWALEYWALTGRLRPGGPDRAL